MSETNYLLRLRDVSSRTGLGRSSIYQKMQDGEFPHHVKIGPRAVAWVASEVDAWIAKTIKQHRTTTVAPAPGPGLEA